MSKKTQQHIRETAGLQQLTGERLDITLITAGRGSSGYYPATVLEQAATDKVFPAGTKMFIDHAEGKDKRSVKYLAAVLEQDAQYDPVAERLHSPAKVFTAWREPIKEMAESIGVSIDAAAVLGTTTVDGQVVTAVERILPSPLNSVDFVAYAGRGGRIAQILESATAKETLAETTDQYLTNALRGLYPGRDVWVTDFDPAKNLVYFMMDDQGGGRTGRFQHAYTQNPETGGVALTGAPTPVQKETKYVAVTPVDGQPTTQTQGAPAMEKKLAELQAQITEKNNRIAELESSVAEARERLAETEAERTRQAAAQIVEKHFEGIDAPAGKTRLIESALTGEFDPQKFEQSVTEAAAEYTPTTGAVRGLGDNTAPINEAATVTDEAILEALTK